MTRLLSAVGYLAAIAAGSVSHIHIHALEDVAGDYGCPSHGADSHQECAASDCSVYEVVVDEEHGGAHGAPVGVPPTHDDDCSICRFLGRPILPVKPFELTEFSQRNTPLCLARAPDVQPVPAVVAHARAPPQTSHSI